MMQRKRPVKVDGREVGIIVGKRYVTRRMPVRHYYKKGEGYPISVSVLNNLKKKGVKNVEIHIIRGGDVEKYTTPISKYENLKSFQHRGYDEQKCVPLKDMKKIPKRKR